VLFGLAAILFWTGGRAISELAHTDRSLAELEGIGLALLFAALGFGAKTIGERVDESDHDVDRR
jgi:hypothetical protein